MGKPEERTARRQPTPVALSRGAAAGSLLAALLLFACGPGDPSPAPGPSEVAGPETPPATARTSPPATVTRAILHIDRVAEGTRESLVTKGVYPDGRTLGIVAPALGAAWAPDGQILAYVSADGSELRTVDLQGTEKTVFKSFDRWEPLYAWPLWSPDSQRVAIVTIEWCKGGSRIASLVVIDPADGESVKHGRYDFWQAQGTEDGPTRFSLPKNLRWSPDGKKILVSWDKAVVVDAETGFSETISTRPVIAEWAPGSDAVYFFEIENSDSVSKRELGDFYVKALGATDPVKLMDRQDLAELGLAAGAGAIPVFMNLSPGGNRLAIGSGLTEDATGQLNIYDLSLDATVRLDEPAKSFESEYAIAALEWAPDGNSLATVAVAGDTAAIKVLDLATGTWGTVTSLDLETRDRLEFNFKILSWSS